MGLVDKMIKTRKEIFFLLLLGIVIAFMNGCSKSEKQIIEDSLKDVYNEEFIVHEIKTVSNGFETTVSPSDKPECLFSARIKRDGTYVDEEIKKEIELYFQHDLDLDNYFVEQVAKSNDKDFWDLGVATNDTEDVGCPPKIGVCFIKSMPLYVDNLDEYIRRRELLEYGKNSSIPDRIKNFY